MHSLLSLEQFFNIFQVWSADQLCQNFGGNAVKLQISRPNLRHFESCCALYLNGRSDSITEIISLTPDFSIGQAYLFIHQC